MANNKGLKFGGFYWAPRERCFARIESFSVRNDTNYVVYSLWDPKRPGWQGGAALERDQFEEMFSEQVTEEVVLASKPPKMKIRITAVYEYEVDPSSPRTLEAYKTNRPDEIFEIDRENAWELMYEQLTEGDDVKISIERVAE